MLYLHLGNNKSVKTASILGIFDLDTATISPITKKFLSTAEKNGCIETVAEELPKSFVVTADDPAAHTFLKTRRTKNGVRIYLSQPAPLTLVQRTERNSLQNV